MENKKKYFNSTDWGINADSTQEHRSEGIAFLKNCQFSTMNYESYNANDFIDNLEHIEQMLQASKSGYIAIFDPISTEVKRCSIPGNTLNVKQIRDYISNNTLDLTKYNICFTERILSVTDSFCGVTMSDGQGNTAIEILSESTNLIELTSAGVDSSKIAFYRFYDFEKKFGVSPTINSIKELCQYFKGYYEFIYGQINGISDIYFTSYSDNEMYLNIFKAPIQKEFIKKPIS